MSSTEAPETIETLRTVPALLIDLEHPEKLDEYEANPDEPIPVIIKSRSGVSLNDFLPEDLKIYLCQNEAAKLITKSDPRFRGKSLLFRPKHITLSTDALNELGEYDGLDENNLEELGKLLFDVALVRRDLEIHYRDAKEVTLRNQDVFWNEHPKDRDEHGYLNRDVAEEYVRAVNVYTGIYSTAVAEALTIANQLGFGSPKKEPSYKEKSGKDPTARDLLEIDLYNRLQAHYNAKLAETYKTVAAGLATLQPLAQAPNEDNTVRFFNPRLEKYVSAPWEYHTLVELSEGEYKAPTSISTIQPNEQESLVSANEPTDDRPKRALTRLYEANFPEKPLGLIVQPTGKIVTIGNLEGPEVLVKTSDGLSELNDFLPKGQTILDIPNPDVHCFFAKNETSGEGHVVIDFDYFHRNEISDIELICIIAHEIGHAFNKTRKTDVDLKELKKTVYNNQVIFEFEEALEIVDQLAHRMEDEADAWNEGKLIATACGVDDALYEGSQEVLLATYFHTGLYLTLQVIEHCHQMVDSDELEIYNPYIQEYRKLTVAEIRALVNSTEFHSKAKTAYIIADKVLPDH